MAGIFTDLMYLHFSSFLIREEMNAYNQQLAECCDSRVNVMVHGCPWTAFSGRLAVNTMQ